jgi:hypothetical protein
MTEESSDRRREGPRQVRLPGFVRGEPVGLGDAVKRATSLVGMRPCGPCQERAKKLNTRVVFTTRNR